MIASSTVPAAWDPIDHVLALDPGGRGIARFVEPGAAGRAARALRGARRVLIVTGFSVPPGLPETDGPPGAAVLGRALRRSGASVRYVTDAEVMPVMTAALKALDEPDDVLAWPAGREVAGAAAARAVAGDLLARERPTHLVAIERPGRSRSGDYLSARGESVAPWNAPLDEMFVLARRMRMQSVRSRVAPTAGHPRLGPGSRTPLQTIAVGDGGNEIGMGNLRPRLARRGRLPARIASVVRADHLVVAGVSNWGAYGIVAALASSGRFLHTAADERRLVEACVEAGAVDGVTRRAEPTVDALPLEAHAAVVELLRLVSA